MKKILCFLIAAAVLPQALSAQKAYPGGVEFGFGPSYGVYKVKGDTKNALGSATGGNYYLRYTHFVKGPVGIYAEVRDVLADAYDYQYFGALNKADGGKYRYRFTGSEYDMGYNPVYTVGGAYRFARESFNLILRAGIGYGERDSEFSYERQSRDGSTGPEYYSIASATKAVEKDYLINSGYTYYKYASGLVLSGGAQLVWNTRRRVYFFGEALLDASPSKYLVNVTYTGSKKDYDPSNFVEAVSSASRKDVWTKDTSSTKTTTDRLGMGMHLNIAFGIGINMWKASR